MAKKSLFSTIATVVAATGLTGAVAGGGLIAHTIATGNDNAINQPDDSSGIPGPQGERGETGPQGPQGPQGEQGPAGKDGVSVSTIAKTHTDGLVDTYTITYSDGTTSTFVIVNGRDGAQGAQGIAGDDGHTPSVTIGNNGNWFVDGVDTGMHAQGKDGTDGISIRTGNGEPSQALGKNNDSYIDLNTYNFYIKQNGIWHLEGNIKGPQGEQGQAGLNGVSIVTVLRTGTSGLVDTYTITYSDGTTSTFTITNGANGQNGQDGAEGHTPVITIGDNNHWYVDGVDTGVNAKGQNGATGAAGNGIASIDFQGSTGLVDTYRITFTDGTTTYFNVKNGQDGAAGADGAAGQNGSSVKTGNGVPNADVGDDGDSYINLVNWDYYVKDQGVWVKIGNIKGAQGEQGQQGQQGEQGQAGQDGVSVVSIEKTSSNGLVDTYTITYSNNQTSTFYVTNGAAGAQGEQGEAGAAGSKTLFGVGAPASTNGGQNGDSYIDSMTWNYYFMENGAWVLKGCLKGAEGAAGAAGAAGQDGRGIQNIEETVSGLVHTFVITYTDGTSLQFTISDGQNGLNGASLLTGTGAPITSLGVNGDSYIDVSTWNFYKKEGNYWVLQGNIKGQDGTNGSNGVDGHTPVVTIGNDGHWYVDGVDTGVNAVGPQGQQGPQGPQGQQGPQGDQGPQGQQGIPGVDGTSVTTGNGAPDNNAGKNGDSYIDLDSWDYYVKENGAWVLKGNIHSTQAMYTVTFYVGEEVVATRRVPEGGKVSRPTADETAGYTITDWYYLDGVYHESWRFVGYSVTEDMTLHAEYTCNEYTIHFADRKYGTSTSDLIVHYSQAYSLPTPTDSGYAFVGWSKIDGTMMNDSSPYRIASDVTLYAVWGDANTYTVTFTTVNDAYIKDPYGDYVHSYEASMTYGSSYTLPVLDGYYEYKQHADSSWSYDKNNRFKFIGWYYQEAGERIYVSNNANWDITSNVTLTAGWHYYSTMYDSVLLDAGNGLLPNGHHAQLLEIDEDSSYELPIPTAPLGYSFVEWQKDGVAIPNSGTWTYDNACLTAKYVSNANYLIIVNNVVTGLTNDFPGGSIIIPEGVTSIGNNAFRQKNVTGVSIPSSLKTIGMYAFATSKLESITLPDTVESIEDAAFYGCSKLTSVTLSDSISTIPTSAFNDCDKLTSVDLPANLLTIGNSAFARTSSLKSITLPDTLTSIGESAFEDSRLESLVIHNGVTVIGDKAFKGNGWLEINTLPDTLTSIGEQAFGYTAIEEITIPDSVENIGDEAFYGCYGLREIHLGSGMRDISWGMFRFCANLSHIEIPSNITTINAWAFRDSGLQSIVVPNTVTQIGGGAFTDCDSLESITLPFIGRSATEYQYFSYIFGGDSYEDNATKVPASLKTVTIGSGCTSIPDYAFYGCSNIETINLPQSLTSIGDHAFDGCTSLTNINIPDGTNRAAMGVRTIGEYAFKDCTSLTVVVVPNCVDEIGLGAFAGCTSLASLTVPYIGGHPTEHQYFAYYFGKSDPSDTSLYVPDSLKTIRLAGNDITIIPEKAFYGCSSVKSIYFPDSVTSFEENAFYFCTNLRYVDLPASLTELSKGTFANSGIKNITLPSGLERIDEYAFYKSGLETIVIPNSVTYIGDSAFQECKQLTSVHLPNNLSYLGISAFDRCEALVEINIPSTLTSIPNRCFAMTSLKSIVLPEGIVSINDMAFATSEQLTSINFPSTLTTIGQSAFEETGFASLVIPDTVTSIGKGAFYRCDSLISISVPFIGGSATENCYMSYIFRDSGKITASGSKYLTSITVRNVTVVPEYAFYKHTNLTSVTFSANITSISEQAFAQCGFTTFVVPSSVTSIAKGAFQGCSKLTSISVPFVGGSKTNNRFIGYIFGADDYTGNDDAVPASLKTVTVGSGTNVIPERGFYGCTNITTVNLTQSITKLEDRAFSQFPGLTQFTFPNSVTEVGGAAFANSTNLTSVTFSSSVTVIGSLCFENCTGLTSVTLPSNLDTIPFGMFRDCSSLSSITFPSCLTTIENNSFTGTGFTSLVIPDTVTSIGRSAFNNCPSLTSLTVPCLCKAGENNLFFGYMFGANSYDQTSSYIRNELTKVILTGGLTHLTSETFYGCRYIENLTLPKTLTQIDRGALSQLTKLSFISIPFIGLDPTTTNENYFGELFGYNRYSLGPQTGYIPADLDSVNITGGNGENRDFLPHYSFRGCKSIEVVDIDDNITEIGVSAFENCEELRIAYLPKNCKTIGMGAFYFCQKLDMISFPTDSIEVIGSHAFFECDLLWGTITFGTNLRVLGDYAFEAAGIYTSFGYTSFSYKGSQSEFNRKVDVGNNNDWILEHLTFWK